MSIRYNPNQQTNQGYHLPEEWSSIKLRQVAKRIRRTVSGDPEHVLMITSEHGFISQDEKYSREMAGKSLKNYTHLRHGEFAYNKGNSKSYPQGCIYQLLDWEQGAVPSVYISFSLNNNKIDHGFARQFFAAGGLNYQLARLISSSARSNGLLNISIKEFFEVELPAPPLPEQKKIAAILSSVDEAIEATEAVIEQTRTVKKGLLQELLTRGIGHTEFKKTAIGEIPKSWRLSTLGDEFSSSSLKNGIYKPQDLYGSGTQIVRIDNYQNGEHLDSSQLRKVQLEPEEIESYELQHGDILINRVNSLSHLGKTTYISNLTERTVFESNMMRLRLPNNPTLSPEFTFLHLSSDHIKSFFQGRAKKAVAQTSISQDDILAIPVTIPPQREQNEICTTFNSIETLLIQNNKQLHYLTNLKRGLLQDLLTGKVRVNTLDLPALLNAEAPAEAQAE